MSLILAVKKNHQIYMASDTQTSYDDRKINFLAEKNQKIIALKNGILIGSSGLLHNIQLVFAHPEYFTVPSDGHLTKKHLVQVTIPCLLRLYKENNLFSKESGGPRGTMSENYLIAHKDRLFHINSAFSVKELHHYGVIGSGSTLAFAALCALDESSTQNESEIEEGLLRALRIASTNVMTVSGPYNLIDTTRRTSKIVG